jgi:hypothetical protein
MRKPDVPKDWLVAGFRWGIPVPGVEPEDRWIAVADMDGFADASEEKRTLWWAYRRASQIQDAVCAEVNRRLPEYGYASRTELAESPAGERSGPTQRPRTQISVSTLRNILGGQRFMTLKEVAQLEKALGGSLINIVRLEESRDGAGAQAADRAVDPKRQPRGGHSPGHGHRG